jgi:hypothetical protein
MPVGLARQGGKHVEPQDPSPTLETRFRKDVYRSHVDCGLELQHRVGGTQNRAL